MSVDAHGELQRAIVQNELEVHYQPILDMRGEELTALEALVRWRHPTRGVVTPQAIIPLAEREGVMHELTAFVLREALLQSSVWRKDHLAVRLAVNLDMTDLRDDRFRRLIEHTLRIAGGGEVLVAEIHVTDTAAEIPVVALVDLRKLSITLTLDDVTSVEQLDAMSQLPLDQAKLGRDVIGRAVSDPRAREIARGIAALAAARRLPIVAVGVENAESLDFARSIGCVGAQGYLFARPMTSQETGRWMRSRA